MTKTIIKTILKKSLLNSIIFSTILLSLFSCKKNYIIYYNKINEIDSTYRLTNNPSKAIKQYQEIFKQYPPKNQERIEEFATYIKLADAHQQDFGGQKNLYRLIPLIAPYHDEYKKYLPLFNKYGIDNQTVKQKINEWNEGLDKKLIDSFKIALIRDQQGRPHDTALVRKNVEKNAAFFIWVFKKHGFPSPQKVGWFPMSTMISHLSESKKHYPYIKNKIEEYVISGECPPRDYARMVDTDLGFQKKITLYGFNTFPIKDSSKVNRNRKRIGIPSIEHSMKIRKDFFKKFKKNDTHYIE